MEGPAVALLGLHRSKSLRQKVAWAAVYNELHEQRRSRLERARLQKWWDRGMNKRAPVLESGNGADKGGMRYGAESNYGELLTPRMSAMEFYYHFRFAREHIPRLVKALKMPEFVRTAGRCCLSGEEALLLFLKRLSYPDRLVGLVRFFSRSTGWISEMFDAVRRHLDGLTDKMMFDLDWERIKPLAPRFAHRVHVKGMPLPHVPWFVDGVFVSCCRPSDPVVGYRSVRQRCVYNGSKRQHGLMYQGLVTPDGIIVEMWGPFQGRINDKCRGRWCAFGDRGYAAGPPSLHVPFIGVQARVEPGRTYNILRLRRRPDSRQRGLEDGRAVGHQRAAGVGVGRAVHPRRRVVPGPAAVVVGLVVVVVEFVVAQVELDLGRGAAGQARRPRVRPRPLAGALVLRVHAGGGGGLLPPDHVVHVALCRLGLPLLRRTHAFTFQQLEALVVVRLDGIVELVVGKVGPRRRFFAVDDLRDDGRHPAPDGAGTNTDTVRVLIRVQVQQRLLNGRETWHTLPARRDVVALRGGARLSPGLVRPNDGEFLARLHDRQCLLEVVRVPFRRYARTSALDVVRLRLVGRVLAGRRQGVRRWRSRPRRSLLALCHACSGSNTKVVPRYSFAIWSFPPKS
mmetsp:Transcript_22628/g.77577  ORF Transcript_22628/g.77577 Transcript_22628/m.77577 type:complete len:624 (-) Transcript_22628:25-1896(-)